MKMITIKIKNEKVFNILKDLEALNLIEIIGLVTTQPKKSLSERLCGSVSREQADLMHEELKQMRNEWERD
jgi:hypothetical protein